MCYSMRRYKRSGRAWMQIAVIGLSHRTAPVEIREKVSIPEQQVAEYVSRLRSCSQIAECAILSTCNRLEIYAVLRDSEHGLREVTQFLAESKGVALPMLQRHLFTLLHQDAVMHLMRVAAGLDSIVLGEGQILAQIKVTHKLAQQGKGVDRILNQLFKAAITGGKRVREETDIGKGAISVSSAAVEIWRCAKRTAARCRTSAAWWWERARWANWCCAT